MRSLLRRFSPQTWLLLYLGCVVLGSGALLGGGLVPAEWFVGWHWWQRLLLVLLASPVAVLVLALGYGTFELGLEALARGAWYFFKEYTLTTIIFAVVVIGGCSAAVSMLRG
ncbi:hypothetical protein [Diaphorobacter nitroreducens]|uniref:hypothetical protein n=1 Tax=Diaphorobacter nitroreducens TaxID=164759 RepID=UPI0035ADCEAE